MKFTIVCWCFKSTKATTNWHRMLGNFVKEKRNGCSMWSVLYCIIALKLYSIQHWRSTATCAAKKEEKIPQTPGFEWLNHFNKWSNLGSAVILVLEHTFKSKWTNTSLQSWSVKLIIYSYVSWISLKPRLNTVIRQLDYHW